MGRYTLKINGEPIPKFTKVSLYEIDRFTTNYAQESEIAEALGKKNISIKNLKISYRAYNQENTRPVAFDSKKDLQDITLASNGGINYTNRIFLKYANAFCDKIKADKEFYKFVLKSASLNLKLKEYIQLHYENNDVYYKNKIIKHLGSYTQFRSALFIMENYEWIKSDRKTIQEKLHQEEDDDQPTLEDENFTKEEIEQYQEYMANLPDEEHPHYGR